MLGGYIYGLVKSVDLPWNFKQKRKKGLIDFFSIFLRRN